jgi:hypothetical protein
MLVAREVDGTPQKSKMSMISSSTPHATITSSIGRPGTGLTGLFCDGADEGEAQALMEALVQLVEESEEVVHSSMGSDAGARRRGFVKGA